MHLKFTIEWDISMDWYKGKPIQTGNHRCSLSILNTGPLTCKWSIQPLHWDMLWSPEIWLFPQSSSIWDWDFPWDKPSIGSRMGGTPIPGNQPCPVRASGRQSPHQPGMDGDRPRFLSQSILGNPLILEIPPILGKNICYNKLGFYLIRNWDSDNFPMYSMVWPRLVINQQGGWTLFNFWAKLNAEKLPYQTILDASPCKYEPFWVTNPHLYGMIYRATGEQINIWPAW